MNLDLIITFAIIGIGIFLFVKDFFSIDTTSIIIMTMFIIAGVLNPEEGFSGFNHPATLTLGCIFVVSGGVFRSGILDGLNYRIIKLAKIHYSMALLIFCLISGFFSAFINDTAVVAMLLPIVLTVCRETNISPSKLLMPISFAALFGGTCTLIGTSTNILVSSYAEKYGLEGFGMFEFSKPALLLMAIGFVYIFLMAPILLPKNRNSDSNLTQKASEYLTEVLIKKGNPDINKTIEHSKLVKEFNVNILHIIRQGKAQYNIDRDTKIFEDDILKVIAPPHIMNRLLDLGGYKIKGHKKLENSANTTGFKSDTGGIYEVIIPFGSSFVERSLKELNFRRQYNCSVIAIRHREEIKYSKLNIVKLKEGDMLLLLGKEEEVKKLELDKQIIKLSEYIRKKTNYKKAIPALLIGIGVVLAASLNLTSILISAMVGALFMIIIGILSPKEAYNVVEWKVIFMMAGVLSMGTALEKTGGAKLIADFIQNSLGQYNTYITLSLLYLITLISTNLISSKATAALMTPIVISLASVMGVSERPFLVAVMFACSLTFMTPMSYPTNTMVYAPGNYKFNDFLKFGSPLNLIIWIVASLIIPYFFPF